MAEEEFHQVLIEFINNLLLRKLSNNVTLTFYIELQPNSGSFGGTIVNNQDEKPLNLFNVSKQERTEFLKKIYSFHTASTNHGLNKWNKATFTIAGNQSITSKFYWDEDREQMEREQAIIFGTTTPKWHWE